MGDVNCRVITLLLGNLWMVDSLGGAYSRRVMPGAASAGGDGVTRERLVIREPGLALLSRQYSSNLT